MSAVEEYAARTGGADRAPAGTDRGPSLTYSDAEKYRFWQAENLLREAGFVPHADGTWHQRATR